MKGKEKTFKNNLLMIKPALDKKIFFWMVWWRGGERERGMEGRVKCDRLNSHFK